MAAEAVTPTESTFGAVVRAFLQSAPEWSLDSTLSFAPPEDEDAHFAARMTRAPNAV